MHDKLTAEPVRTEGTKLAMQAERPRKRSSTRLIIIVILIALAIGGVIAWRSTHKTETTAAAGQGGRGGGDAGGGGRGVPVVVAATQKQDLPVYMDGLGSVEAFNTVTIKSRIDGQLLEIHFNEGQEIKKGDLLAVIDARPFEVALSQAQAMLFRDQFQLTDAQRNLERYQQLVAQGIVPQQQYDTQSALVGQLQGSIRADQAQIDSANLNITYSNITSPIDGRVGLRLVDVGNMVHAADPNGMLVITQMQPISVIFTLPEDNLPAVNNRMRGGAPLQVKELSRDNGTDITSGTLLTIDNQIDQTTGTFRLKAVFDNKDRALWPNQFVNARLLLEVKKDATVIPSAAIQTGAQGMFVYVVKPDKTVEVRPVTVGITEGTMAAIDSGLSKGELVVTDGQDRLRAGIQVEARSDSGASASAPEATNSDAAPGRRGARSANGQAGSAGGAASYPGQSAQQGSTPGYQPPSPNSGGQGFQSGAGGGGGRKRKQ